MVAEQRGRLVGWVSGYRPPNRPDELFIWQVAVDLDARGRGLGERMILSLLARPAAQGVAFLTSTVTGDNRASWRLFEAIARRLDAPLEKTAHFERETHFAGKHDTEWQARISPLPDGCLPEIIQETL